ncbi:MAG: SRPBCC family protein [Pseudomonadota bacterium]
MAANVLTESINISCPPAEVFDFIVDVENGRRWFPGIGEISAEDSLAPGTPGKRYAVQLIKPNGDPLSSTIAVTRCTPGQELAVEAQVLGSTLTTSYRVEPSNGDGTRFSWVLDSDAHGLRAAIRERVMRKVLRAKVVKALEGLRLILERDEERAMTAVRIHRFGPAREVTAVEPYAPRPTPGKGEVLVAQIASSINHIDVARRGGYGRKLLGLKGVKGMPMILGNDVYGEVVSVGPGVEGFTSGDTVFGAKPPSAQGAFAQYVAAPAKMLRHAPKDVGANQLAASPYAFFSAWGPLVGDCGLNEENGPNSSVFIQGGGGAVGSCAIAIAKSFGAFVATNCGPDDIERVRDMGADAVFDYREGELAGNLSNFDIAFCTANPDAEDQMLALLRKGADARYTTVIHPTMRLGDELGAFKGLMRAKKTLGALNKQLRDAKQKAHWSMYKGNTEALEALAGLLSSGRLKLRIAKHFPLAEMVAAQELMEAGVSGKLVVDIG